MTHLHIAAAFAAAIALGAAVPFSIPRDPPVVRPTGGSIPDNLLRLSISFPRPPSSAILPRLALTEDDGAAIVEPFLEQELWSPDGRTLTVLMHPGRVKSGLVASERLGRALVAGQTVWLTLDGRRLRRWTVTASDLLPPDPRTWHATRPRAGSREPVAVTLDGPVDALDGGLIAIRAPDGRRLPGAAVLSAGETVWTFTPEGAWGAGPYTVVAAPDLEDPAGNRPGQDFEHAPGAEPILAEGPAFSPRQAITRK